MEHFSNSDETPAGVSSDDNECCQFVRTLREMSGQLEEGGPNVIEDDLIGYVHRILPVEIEQQVRLNIVSYRSWYDAYREALNDKIEFDKTTGFGRSQS